MKGKIKIGPVGNENPRSKTTVDWDEGSHSGIISQIFLSHGSGGILSIQFQFVLDDKFVLSDRHGRNIGNKFDVIALNCPHEYIIGISGEYRKTSSGLFDLAYIRSLKFTTNTNTYGPFGTWSGLFGSSTLSSEEKFDFKLGKFCQFGGFHGTYDDLGLQKIGVYLRPSSVKPTNNAKELESNIVLG